MNNYRQFGVWMDKSRATIVGNENREEGDFRVLAHIKAKPGAGNSNERSSANQERTLQSKFFKEISSHLTNATHIHVTGTGQVQEQFIKYLAETPQFRNTKTAESAAYQMSDEKLMQLIAAKF